MSSSNVEAALRRYYTSYDGTPKEFEQVEDLFDTVYHKNFTLFLKDNGDSYVDPVRGNLVGREAILDRDAVKKFHASYLSKGAKVFLIHYRRIGLDCVDVQFKVESSQKEIQGNFVWCTQLRIIRLLDLRKSMITSSRY